MQDNAQYNTITSTIHGLTYVLDTNFTEDWSRPLRFGLANPDAPGGVVVKREDGGPGRSLANDYAIHSQLLQHLEDLESAESQINIPSDPVFVQPDDPIWGAILPNLPVGYTACNGLISERIPPMSRRSREVVIAKYCPECLREQVSKDEYNDDCIIRPYLGRRRRMGTKSQSRFAAFTLRNYPLNVDQMEELGLDLPRYARAMACSLAYMHWKVQVDANDVEFVIAPPRPASESEDGTEELGTHSSLAMGPCFTSGLLEDHALWILDFDCCRAISMDEAGVEQAVAAFYRNDPFYPRPGRTTKMDQDVWEVFCAQYLLTSRVVLEVREEDVRRLPTLFIQQLITRVGDFKAGRHH